MKKEKETKSQEKTKKENKEQKALKKVKEEGKSEEVFKKFRRKWLISGLNTALIISIFIAIFIFVNMIVAKIDPTPIDCTKNADMSLTDESKERVKNIESKINIYYAGTTEENQSYILAKQYNKANSNINVEVVDIETNLEFSKKYKIEDAEKQYLNYGYGPIVVVATEDDYRKFMYGEDMISYNSSTGQQTDLSEQKITSAILNLTSNVIPKVYFLTGYTDFSLSSDQGGLSYLSQLLEYEVLTYEELNLLNKKEIPDDCDTLIIMTPNKDFDKAVGDEIIKYINKGGNILWLNGAVVEKKELKNVNRVLAEYGIKPFETGVIYETNPSYMNVNQLCIVTETQYSTITDEITGKGAVLFLQATKINVDEEKLSELKVEKTDLILSSEDACFAKDLTGVASDKDEKKAFVLGAQMVKTISEAEDEKEAIKSEIVIYGNDYFVSDIQLSQGYYPMALQGRNIDLALNTIAHLTNKDEDITIRKNFYASETSFTATEGEKLAIMLIIFIVPVGIMTVGLAIWAKRRNIKGAFYTFVVITVILVGALIWELLTLFVR